MVVQTRLSSVADTGKDRDRAVTDNQTHTDTHRHTQTHPDKHRER